jgi:hypothetical protein
MSLDSFKTGISDHFRRPDKTFRIQKVPLRYSSKPCLIELLERILQCSQEETGLNCQSLAVDQTGKHLDATIIFEYAYPLPLQTASFPHSVLIDTEDISSGYIIIDENFLGLTVLYSCDETHHEVK